MKHSITIVKEVIDKMESQPRFIAADWGETNELNSLLAYDKTKDGTQYPLIIMNPNYVEDWSDTTGVSREFTTDFYFITDTKDGYTTEERCEEIYEKILYPLFDEFLYTAFRENKFIFDENPNMANEFFIPHTKEHLYYRPNILNDIIDTLKITITLKIY